MSNDKSLKVNWILPRASLSGGIKSNRLIAEAMVRRGHQVSIYFVDLPPLRPSLWRIRTLLKYYLQRLQSIGKQRHHLEDSAANLNPVHHCPISVSDVEDADVVIATWWETAYWIKNWPECKGKKAYFIRAHELYGGDPDQVRATYLFPYKKFVIASWLKKLMAEEYGDENATLVPNGIDWKQFCYLSREKQPTPTVGFLFGVIELKGASTAFNALKLVRKKIPNLRVICFGSHKIGNEFEIPGNFQFFFRPKQSLIPEIYRSVDCWLVPSTTEGFGMPGLEAAACGCPVISTRCGGPEDYVEDDVNGYLANVGDEEDIAGKLLKVLLLPGPDWKTMSSNSAEIAKKFDWDKSAAILEDSLSDMKV